MALSVLPNTPANRRLAAAVQRLDEAGARAALADGADPNTYLSSWWRPIVARAAALADKTPCDPGAEGVVAALIQAGVDLAATWPTQAGRDITSALHDPQVRAHPVLGPLCVVHAQRSWQCGLDEADARSFLRACWGDGAVDEALREALFAHAGPTVYPDAWNRAALGAATGALLDYCARKEVTPSLDQVGQWLEKPSNSTRMPAGRLAQWMAGQDGAALARWLVQPTPTAHRGLLVRCDSSTHESVRAVLWRQALANPQALEAMSRSPGGLAGYAVLAVQQEAAVAQAFLAHCVAGGVDLASVRGKDAHALMAGVAQGGADSRLPEDAGLLSCHLRRPDQTVSVALCRKLVGWGVAPSHADLCALVARMTYAAKERQLVGLFRQWIKRGADPMPEGQPPVWQHVRPGMGPSVGARLEAWCRAWRMESALGKGQAPSGPARRRL